MSSAEVLDWNNPSGEYTGLMEEWQQRSVSARPADHALGLRGERGAARLPHRRTLRQLEEHSQRQRVATPDV